LSFSSPLLRPRLLPALFAAAAALLAISAPAQASSRLFFGFSDNLPMLAGARATTPAAALGARGYVFTLTWTTGRTALTPDDARGLALALRSVAKAPRPLIRVPVRKHGRHAKPKLRRAPTPRVILVIQTLWWRGVPLDDSARTDFCTYARSAIASFRSIKDVVIGNEANSSFFWRPQFNWDGSSAAPAAYEALLARCYDMLHAFRPNVNVAAPGTGPDGNDNPYASSNISHSPTSFIRGMADAYRASGRTAPIFDTVVHHPYGLANDERPYLMHPLPNSIGEGDWERLVTTYKDAFAATAQAVPGRCFRGRKCPRIWYLETGFQTTPLPGKQGYYGIENVRTIPDVATVASSSTSDPTAPAPDQARQIRDAVRLAYCQPYVDAIFNFLIRDDPNLVGYQSGVLWTDWTRKRSFPAVKRVVRAVNRGKISCRAPRAPGHLVAQVTTGPTAVSLTWQPASSPVGLAGYTVYRGGVRLGTTTGTTFVDVAVTPGTRYTYTVRAFDAAGKTGLRSRRARVAVP
jgi:hypothetical protein